MPLEVRKQEKESSQSLVRRFTQRMQKSGILKRAKRTRFFSEQKSKTVQKNLALRREKVKKEFEKAQKLAKPE